MDPEAFRALLDRLIADGELDLDQTRDLWVAFQRGELQVQPVLPPRELPARVDDDSLEEAALLLLLLLGLRGRDPDRVLAGMGRDAALRALNALQDAWKDRAVQLAAALARGELDLAGLQVQAMQGLARVYTGAMQLALRRSRLTPAELERLNRLLAREAAFLSRMADQLALADAQGRALSPGSIAHRLAMYGGQARAEFYRSREAAEIGGNTGWVVRYVARDDERTCTPCHNAQGYYLPGEGPMPGDVCLGGGYCRCRRVPEYNPTEWARLTGVPAGV